MPSVDDAQAAEEMGRIRKILDAELSKRIVGQKRIIELLLTSMFARGHCLFVGVPGLAKTLLISTLAQALNLRFNRIQFTPDLMPSDITGTDVLEEDATTGKRIFRFIQGPVFCNILLADEINRTPPKTQAALLQAMQEQQVTASGTNYPLTPPFLVFATQNPIEQEGTYPLPEAQLDRFMFSIDVQYPEFEDEVEIVRTTTRPRDTQINKVLTPEEICRFQDLVLRVPVADHVVRYAVKLVQATRPAAESALPFVKEYVSWGAGPRASQCLILGGKAHAVLNGRSWVGTDDVRFLAHSVLQHRILPNFHAEADRIDSRAIIDEVLRSVVEEDIRR
ncbi:MAG: MoxR family ATPase [Myxococcales bacterium]|nr:MoxR family ATPase [Myxococcales bacterium]